MIPSQLINTVSGVLGPSVVTNDRPYNLFFRRSGLDLTVDRQGEKTSEREKKSIVMKTLRYTVRDKMYKIFISQ